MLEEIIRAARFVDPDAFYKMPTMGLGFVFRSEK